MEQLPYSTLVPGEVALCLYSSYLFHMFFILCINFQNLQVQQEIWKTSKVIMIMVDTQARHYNDIWPLEPLQSPT